MRTLAVAISLALVACTRATSTTTEAPPAPAPAKPQKRAPPPTSLPTCVTVTDAPLALDHVRIDVDQVGLCVDGAPRSCWRVDLATGSYTAVRDGSIVAPPPPALPTATTQADGSVQLCPAPTAACVAFRPRGPASDPDARWSVSADGKRAARLAASTQVLDVFDVATGKRTAHLKAWKTPMSSPSYFDDPTFAGDRVIAWIHYTPVSDKGRIFTGTGRKLADIGDRDFSQNTVDSWPLDGSQWAFKQLDRALLIAVDLRTGKLVRRFDLKPLAVAAGTPDALAEPAAIAAFPGRLVYVASGAVPVVALLDRKTGAAKAFAAPRCP